MKGMLETTWKNNKKTATKKAKTSKIGKSVKKSGGHVEKDLTLEHRKRFLEPEEANSI